MTNKRFWAIISLSMVLCAAETCLLYNPVRIRVEQVYEKTFRQNAFAEEGEKDISENHLAGEDILIFSDIHEDADTQEEKYTEIKKGEGDTVIQGTETTHLSPESQALSGNTYPKRKTRDSFPSPQAGTTLQFVVFAFDGSRSLESWEKTLSFAEAMRKSVPEFSYTYFINPVYLLTSANRKTYTSPTGEQGASAIGFGGSREEVQKRISFINKAIEQGHEIGSHAVGHWNGSGFTKEQWQKELDSFKTIFFGMSTLYPGYGIKLNPEDMIGFRAPELGINTALYETLETMRYQYDTSKTEYSPIWPKKDTHGLWQFPLDVIKLGSTNKNILAMDYNFYYTQTGATNTVKQGTPEWEELHKETLLSYTNYFQSRYRGNRAPVYIANHFGLWNDGVYWETMKDVARAVCTLPDVWCGSYRDLMDYMNLHPELSGKK